MTELSESDLQACLEHVPDRPGARHAAETLDGALQRAPSAAIALLDTFAEFMESIAETYFGKPWNEEHEFSLFARLSDDPRAWGYGSDEEIEPLRWLWEATAHWFDGARLQPADSWLEAFEAWAEGQESLVRRATPEALDRDALPRPDR